MPVNWERRHEAFKAIHDAIRSGIAQAPEGKTITKIEATYDGDGDYETLVFKQGTDTLFTLTFGYDGNKNWTSITRTEP